MAVETPEAIGREGSIHTSEAHIQTPQETSGRNPNRYYGVSPIVLQELAEMPIETPDEEALGKRETPHELLYRLISDAEKTHVITQAVYSVTPGVVEMMQNTDWIPEDQRRIIERKMFEELHIAGIRPDTGRIVEQYEETMGAVNDARAIYRMERYLQEHNIPVSEDDDANTIHTKYMETLEAEADRRALEARQGQLESPEQGERLRQPLPIVNAETGEPLHSIPPPEDKHVENFLGMPIERIEDEKVQAGAVGLVRYPIPEHPSGNEPFIHFNPATVIDANVHFIQSYNRAGRPENKEEDYPDYDLIRVRETQQIPGTDQTITYERFFRLDELAKETLPNHLLKLRKALDEQRKRSQSNNENISATESPAAPSHTAVESTNVNTRSKRGRGFSFPRIFGFGRGREGRTTEPNENRSNILQNQPAAIEDQSTQQLITGYETQPLTNDHGELQEETNNIPDRTPSTEPSHDTEKTVVPHTEKKYGITTVPLNIGTEESTNNIQSENSQRSRPERKVVKENARQRFDGLVEGTKDTLQRLRRNWKTAIILAPILPFTAGLVPDMREYTPPTHMESLAHDDAQGAGPEIHHRKDSPDFPAEDRDTGIERTITLGPDGLWGISNGLIDQYNATHADKVSLTDRGITNALTIAQETFGNNAKITNWSEVGTQTPVDEYSSEQVNRLIDFALHPRAYGNSPEDRALLLVRQAFNNAEHGTWSQKDKDLLGDYFGRGILPNIPKKLNQQQSVPAGRQR